MQPQTNVARLSITAFVGVILIVACIVGLMFGCKAYTRYQKRTDAHNQIQVTKQKLQVAEIEKEIKKQIAIGQKLANQEISKRLTPLFVQYEALQSMVDAAHSGAATIIYYPVGANGVPLISTTGKPQVYGGDSK